MQSQNALPQAAEKVAGRPLSPGAGATGADHHRTSPAATPRTPPLAGPSRGVATGDWDELLSAVKAKIRQTVGELSALAPGPQAQNATGSVRAGVLQCVAALDQVQTALRHDLGRRQQLGSEAFGSRIALGSEGAQLAIAGRGERSLRNLAWHDTPPALQGSGVLRERLQAALAANASGGQSLALLRLDLDGFKSIVDAHGLSAGDELLKIVAARLMRSLRADDIVGHLGGDEFAVLPIGALNRKQLSQLACKLFDAVSAPVTIGALVVAVRPSIGIAIGPDNATGVEAWLQRADAAMRLAKRDDCGYAFFDRAADV